MAHIVTCVYCKKRFDRDKYPTIKVSNMRYAHKECAETEGERLKKEEADKLELENYIMQLFKEDYINPRIRKQINTFIETYHYSYSGIKKALIYFHEVKGNSIEKSNGGIGIVPYVYKDAFNYYYSIWEAQQKNDKIKIEDYVPHEKVISIPSPQKNVKKRKLFSFLDEEEEV
jgi:hypothetical protein